MLHGNSLAHIVVAPSSYSSFSPCLRARILLISPYLYLAPNSTRIILGYSSIVDELVRTYQSR